MRSDPNIVSGGGSKIMLDLPARDTTLFRSKTVHDVLLFLSRYHTEEFSITELTDSVDYSQPSISKAIDVLSANDLVIERREGNTRLVHSNRNRLYRPDEPFLQIPQAEFQTPVRTAVKELTDRLDDVIGIVLYGSVARGEADRRSDIDLWVLVDHDRAANQRTANRIRQNLEDQQFESGRYAYDIDIEVLPAVPSYVPELQKILSDGIVVSETEQFETVQQMVLHGDLDE